MKGVVFTEFFEFVEQQHSSLFLQQTINQSRIPSNGVYASTGTYPACEMGALVTALAERTDTPVPRLLYAFGLHLLGHFYRSTPHFFDSLDNAFDFLASIETRIHVDVKKLYPDAELPKFDVLEHTQTKFVMDYKSSRGLGDLCEGLIQGSLDHFQDKATISRTLISDEPETIIRFVLEK